MIRSLIQPFFGSLTMLKRFSLLLAFLAAAGVPTRMWGQETSVKPGINDSFQNPDVEQFIGRFEIESREVYARRDAILDACRIEPGQTVADIGAGTGMYTRLFAHAVGPQGRVFAVDIAKNFLDHIAARSREAGVMNVETVLCQPDSVALPPASVDVAYICDTYHHFEFPLKTMASLNAAMKPGGGSSLSTSSGSRGRVQTDPQPCKGRPGSLRGRNPEMRFPEDCERAGLLNENYFVEFQKVAVPERMQAAVIAGAGSVSELSGAPGSPQRGGKVVLDVTAASARPGELNPGLERAARIYNLYGAAGLRNSDVRVAVVLHGDAAVAALTTEAYSKKFEGTANPNQKLLIDLRTAGADVYICGQTLARKSIAQTDIAEGVTISQSALTTVMSREAAGYALIRVD